MNFCCFENKSSMNKIIICLNWRWFLSSVPYSCCQFLLEWSFVNEENCLKCRQHFNVVTGAGSMYITYSSCLPLSLECRTENIPWVSKTMEKWIWPLPLLLCDCRESQKSSEYNYHRFLHLNVFCLALFIAIWSD